MDILDASSILFETVGKFILLLDSVVIGHFGSSSISYLDALISFVVIGLLFKAIKINTSTSKGSMSQTATDKKGGA